jgi:pimeloyl-ACP methyl ester carboxylesterase
MIHSLSSTRGALLHACLCLPLLALAGCPRMIRLRRDNERAQNLITFGGTLQVEHWQGDPLLVVVINKPAQPEKPALIARRFALEKPGPFAVLLEPGVYMLGAFEDKNRSMRFERDEGERAGVYRELAPIEVKAGKDQRALDLRIDDELPAVLKQIDQATPVQELRHVTEGAVLPLSAARFAPEHAQLGVWQPISFQEQIGMGLFMLETYDPGRVPVLFVHGMGGHPREFEALIGCLDKQRYQAWVVQYASGWRLEPIARGIEHALANLHVQHGFTQLFLVAHSMGGLVSRGVLREHLAHTRTPFITRFVSFASPLGGMPSADKGVSMSPAVVPSWRDIGPESDYVKHLYDQPLPGGIQYSLFFGFDEDDSDGVVSLHSQLRREAQREALHMGGFETTHTGILRDAEACKALQAVLAEKR